MLFIFCGHSLGIVNYLCMLFSTSSGCNADIFFYLLLSGDLIWILTQSQLRAVSSLVQSLMDAAVHTQQNKREEDEDESDSESVDSQDSASKERSASKLSANVSTKSMNSDEKSKPKKSRSSQSFQRRNKFVSEKTSQYMEGRRNLPAHDVIQNSFHLKTGKVDLQLCDDTSAHVQGSLLVQVL